MENDNKSLIAFICWFLSKQPEHAVLIPEKELDDLNLFRKEIKFMYDFDRMGYEVKMREIKIHQSLAEKDGL